MKILISLLLLISFGCKEKKKHIATRNDGTYYTYIDTVITTNSSTTYTNYGDSNFKGMFHRISECDSLLPKGYMILLNSNTKEYIAANNGKYFKSEDTLSVLHGSSMSSWGYVYINNIRDAWRFKDTCELKKYLLYGINKRQKEMDDIDNKIRERKIKDSINNDFKPLK